MLNTFHPSRTRHKRDWALSTLLLIPLDGTRMNLGLCRLGEKQKENKRGVLTTPSRLSLSFYRLMETDGRRTENRHCLFCSPIWRKAIKTVLTEQDIAKTRIYFSLLFSRAKTSRSNICYVQIFFVSRDYVFSKDKQNTIKHGSMNKTVIYIQVGISP